MERGVYICERASLGAHEALALCRGGVRALFLPALGMLCASLRRDGEEVLGRTDELERYVEQGSTIGVPFLHPWANRLEGCDYRAAGADVALDPRSPLLHFDGNGLPMHGVAGARLPWEVDAFEADSQSARLRARLAWAAPDRLAVFPFPHRVVMTATLDGAGLTLATALTPTGDAAVPVSFGHHPYLRLGGTPRDEWWVRFPKMRRLALDRRGIPTGADSDFAWPRDRFGDVALDDAYADVADGARFSLGDDSGRTLSLTFLHGYPCAQIYAPRGRDFAAIEPMTAPPNALRSGCGLRLAAPGSTFTAAFRIEV